ncbi:MAG TPA: hypothetical protein PKE30_17850 [Niabella sp.]|nr:hypothetical protein [Niabella sp.]
MIKGTVFEITNIIGFIPGFVKNEKPAASSFRAAAGHKVYLGFVPKTGLLPGFFPQLQVNVKTGNNGSFSFSDAQVNALKPLASSMFFTVYRTVNIIQTPMGKVDVDEPVYRSDDFPVTASKSGINIFYNKLNLPGVNTAITQAQVDKQVSDFKKGNAMFKKLNATIGSGKVRVNATAKKGSHEADLKFDIELSPYTANDLAKFIRHKVKIVDIDLPGPDFITSICVDEDQIEAAIRSGVNTLMKSVNKDIKKRISDGLNQLAGSSGSMKDVIEKAAAKAVVTFNQLHYPVVKKTQVLPNLFIEVRDISPDICLGFPQRF